MAALTDRMTNTPRRGTLAAAFAVAVFVGIVISQSWAGNKVDGDSLLFFLVVGITYGSVYAVAAVGLVVTYTTSGIFNFAQGAIGMFMAFIFWQLHDSSGSGTGDPLGTGWGIQTAVA